MTDEQVQVVEVHAPAQVVTDVVLDAAGLLEVFTSQGALVVVDYGGSQVVEVVTPGPQGPKGHTGAQGEQGETGPSPTYSQDFMVATDRWEVNHPLNTHPVVTTLDLNGDEIVGDITYPDNSTVIISWGMPFAGRAILKA